MVVAAFLGRPIISFGHHETVADGFEMIKWAAEIINSLGDVCWEGPPAMLRSSYLSRREGSVLRLKLHSSRVVCAVEAGITTVVAELPEGGEHPLLLKINGVGADGTEPQAGKIMTGTPLSVTAGDTVELFSPNIGNVDFRSVPSPGYSSWAFPRRLLCEGRDRLSPLMNKLRGSRTVPATPG